MDHQLFRRTFLKCTLQKQYSEDRAIEMMQLNSSSLGLIETKAGI